ncbi:Transcriptional regulator [Vibrio mytili]|uniref:Uncharacterized protein n=1 Tax=Vibrio mytili TaxID=50718 RepID=A0A0C3EC53_9VIBR|nr:hypothetical protein SU60_04395 [Vibrio mytili]
MTLFAPRKLYLEKKQHIGSMLEVQPVAVNRFINSKLSQESLKIVKAISIYTNGSNLDDSNQIVVIC